MRDRGLSSQLVVHALALSILVGCGGTMAAPVSPTAILPTPTPPVLVTSAETLIGSWEPKSGGSDAMFMRFNADGTCRQSYSLDGLTNGPQVECTYTFGLGVLAMTAVKLNGVPACPSPTGKYEVRLAADGRVQLVATEDTCTPRKNSTRGVYQRIP
jgi:hypothetical protein